MREHQITIVIDFKIYIYLFDPIIRYLIERNVEVNLVAPSEFKYELEETFSGLEITHIDYGLIKTRNRLRFIIHRVCTVLLTRSDFSWQFHKKRHQLTKKARGIQRGLLFLAKFTPKIPNKHINKVLNFIGGLGLSNPYPTTNVMVGSLNASAELLGARNQNVITVMESWDHAVKEPNGYTSDIFLGWNSSLCEDWKRVQGDANCLHFHPLKLRYAHEEVKWQPRKSVKTRILYPAAGTRKFSIGVLVELERQIIDELILASKELDWELYIKPRPNGSVGEFDYALEHSHVVVGSVSHDSISNPANYFYSDKDNQERFSMLHDIDLVVNAFTTFGLDAAAAGLPVLQLDLREATGFEESKLVYNNYHIKQYLINQNHVVKPKDKTLSNYLLLNKSELLASAERYSQNLKEWLFTYDDSSEALDDCLGKMIDKKWKNK